MVLPLPLTVEAGLAQRLGDLAGDPESHIARDQQFLELLEGLVVEPAAGEDRVDALGKTRRAARHPRPEATEPAAALLGLNRFRRRFGCRYLGRKVLGRRNALGIRRQNLRRVLALASSPKPHAIGTPTRLPPLLSTSRIRLIEPAAPDAAKRTAA